MGVRDIEYDEAIEREERRKQLRQSVREIRGDVSKSDSAYKSRGRDKYKNQIKNVRYDKYEDDTQGNFTFKILVVTLAVVFLSIVNNSNNSTIVSAKESLLSNEAVMYVTTHTKDMLDNNELSAKAMAFMTSAKDKLLKDDTKENAVDENIDSNAEESVSVSTTNTESTSDVETDDNSEDDTSKEDITTDTDLFINTNSDDLNYAVESGLFD